ncbi:AAA family ATPase [Xanthomonas euroxanthea]|uniref:AAA family ATPase n=1 Tax=Xanthomonas euroxanthea TaxID=2259622 RepID=UPI001E55427A|nr:ATP-binding protein [Xanthomonas euroxanthea]
MKIITFDVTGLFGRDESVRLKFNDDINIITGRNGSGKTSVLKLLWYVMSGNILLALKEVDFKRIRLVTDLYDCTVHRLSKNTCKIDWLQDGKLREFTDVEDHEGDVFFNAEDEANKYLQSLGSSIFLPTFRRIEGGFTMSDRDQPPFARNARGRSEVEDSLVTLSGRLSNRKHVFVASLSTVDIVDLLFKKYTELSEQYNSLQQKTSQEVIKRIRDFKSDKGEQSGALQLDEAYRVLDEVRQQIESVEGSRETIMRPIEAVRELVMRLFKHSGIQLGKISFGEAAGAVNSDMLSAGEKQMLSFISYNAFYQDAVFIIDEPELSLHVDWQRQLFPTLMSQKTSNQFVIATHSPFIYGKYPDKELQIDTDRGDQGASE